MRFLLVGSVLVLAVSACSKTSGSPWWKFWDRTPSKPFAVEIPAPPEVVMPSTPLKEIPPPKAGADVVEPAEIKRSPASVVQPALRTVYFDYDSAQLREDAKEILRENARWLQEHPQVEVQVQGHCDERGTVEYNFNLGQRRADAVKAFLVGLGVAPNRIHTISYGKERPAVLGHNEDAWRLNRRAEFHTY
ncbi:MAG: peptidoglycan-associated lipoprotein Pal [Candidatus Sumerlaeia bacterium]|nr:peptidoglycan-associated lipoprotein Pal [Candidatus Sumerlaeia bacterium]